MLYLLERDARTVKWNGTPLHEASSAIVKEEVNGDFTLTIRYPITDTGIYQLIKEDMLIKAPTPVIGQQLFRIKKPVENDDSLAITAYHITDDIMKRSIRPVSVVGQSCAMALSQMVQNAKTGLGDFSFASDIMDSRTFNTTETETLYSVLMDGKHSIVGAWEGELVRDNFALSIKRSRGADRGVVITTHKNLKSYQRTKNSQNVVTRIHAKSTFKAEGAETDTVLTVTVDSPLIGNYPYINEKEYENNNAKTVEELREWAEAKFANEGIDKVSDAIEIEAYELDGQVIHLGDTVNIKSRKHDVDLYKKAIAYEYNALTEEYISITFDDKPGVGGSGVSSGVANAADVILGVNANAQEIAVERAVRNANQAFDAEFDKRVEVINDGIEQAKAEAELYADNIKQSIDADIDAVNTSMQAQSEEHDRQVADILSKTQSVEELANQAKAEAELYADNIKQSIDADIDAVNTSMQAQSEEHDRQVADILSKTQSVEELANQAKTDAASAITQALLSKDEAVADARAQVATVSQALNTAKTDLQNQVNAIDAKAVKVQSDANALRTDLNQQAQTLLTQAQAQTALTNRVTTVETLADGTKTTVAELSKTVNKATGDIASVSSRTKTVEDTLSQTRTQYEALTQTVNAQTGQIDSITRKTADLKSGIDGVTERFENLRVGQNNLILNSDKMPFKKNDANTTIAEEEDYFILTSTGYTANSWGGVFWNLSINSIKAGEEFSLLLPVYLDSSVANDAGLGLVIKNHTLNLATFMQTISGQTDKWFNLAVTFKATRDLVLDGKSFYLYFKKNGKMRFKKPILVSGNVIPSDWSPSDEDTAQQIAEYKRTADQNYAGLQSTVSTLDGKVTQNKTEANQTATQLSNRLTSLETYKDSESTRAQSYFEASKTETAKQLTAERTAISANYVAKSIYDENVRGTTLKLNEIKTTADTADGKVTTAETKISQLISDVSSKVSQTDYNTLTGRVDSAETAITQNATEISKRLTSTQVESAITGKGYQTKSQVDNNITGRGYITNSALQPYALSTTVQNLVKETSDSFSRTISETKALIPSEFGGNLLVDSGKGWSRLHVVPFERSTKLYAGSTYTVTARWGRQDNSTLNVGLRQQSGDWQWVNLAYNKQIDAWTKTFVSQYNIETTDIFRFYTVEETGIGSANWATLVKGPLPLASWQPSASELATVTALNNVTDTVDSHTRTIGAVVSTLDGKVTQNKTEANQTATQLSNRLTSLETYKDSESTRAQSYFEASKTETAKQLTAERTAISANYVAKSIYDENVRGTTLKLNEIKTTADTADGKVTTAETKISQLISDVSSKVSQTDYNTLTGRVDSAETAITQNATEISKRLTSTQVESAITGKGYQTKSQVDNNITGRGYITNSALQPYALSTTVQNLVKETSDSFSRTISETKALIPSEFGGNLLVDSGKGWSRLHVVPFERSTKLYAGSTYTVTARWGRQDNSTLNVGLRQQSGDWQWVNLAYNKQIDAWTKTFVSQYNIETTDIFRFYTVEETGIGSANWATLVKGPLPLASWQPSASELATVTALNNVTDTVDSHTRTIGAVGETGSILDNVSKVTQTANGLVTEVSGANGLKTQVSTLAGSYAIKNLTNSGTVLNQLNLNKDGSIKLDGSLVQITGKTYIQDGVISSAKIASLDAGKITTGTLDAARIAVNSIDGSKLVFDQAFVNKMTANEALFKQLFAQNAFITSVQSTDISANLISGGVLKSTNGATNFDLNNGNLLFNNNYGYIRRTANDKLFEITTLLTEKSNYSSEALSSKFMVRKSDFSRQSGVSFNLYTTADGKPTATAQIYSDFFTITSSDYTTLFSLGSKKSYFGTFNLQNWGDIPVAVMSGGLVVTDIGIGGHTESLLKVVERLCSKTGLMWI